MIHLYRLFFPPARRGVHDKTSSTIMRLPAILIMILCLSTSAVASAQVLNISSKGETLQEIFKQIHLQTGYQFFYEDELLDQAGKIDLDVQEASLEETLNVCFKNLPLSFVIVDKTIVVNAKKPAPPVEPAPVQVQPVLPITVSGRVTNNKNEPEIAVAVVIKGTLKGTMTDENGYYELTEVDENAVLVFSAVNIETQEVPVAGRSLIDIVVRYSVSALDEIQVIGYGSAVRRFQTGAVSTLKAEALERQPVSNPLQAIQGRMAGVAITQTAGAIGSGVEIQVRGVNTIESGNQPLIIVDGAVMPDPNRGLGTAIGGYMPWGSNAMDNLNPADIESIEVLKDADATAIYGSRGANGVVLITTKKARMGATRFNLDVSTWANSAAMLPERLALDQYLQMRRDAFAMGNYDLRTGSAINPIEPTPNSAPDLLVWNTGEATTNWPEFEFGNYTPSVNAQADLSGGDKRLNFYSSIGYLRQTDITRGSPFQQRISTNLGLNHTSLNDRLKVNLNVNFVTNDLSPSRGAGSPGLLSSLPPNMPMMNDDGSPFWPPANITQNSLLLNPLAVEEAQTTSNTKNFIGNIDVSYQIVDGLSLKMQVGYNDQQQRLQTLTPSTSINPLNPGSSVPNSVFGENAFQSTNVEPQLNYKTQLGKGNLNVLLGSTFFSRQISTFRIGFDGFSTDALLESWAGGSGVADRRNSSTDYRFNSVFGRATYNWDGKYLINLTYRRDGSSRFGPDRQWGDFGAAGLAWIFTNEPWLQDKIPGLSYGKLRGSYGTSGNDNIADYRWTSLYTSVVYDGRSGLAASFLSNSAVGWETSRKLDAALELGFLENRLLLNANWYRSRTTDLLLSTPTPSQTGFTTFIANTPAVVENKGWEFEISTINLNAASAFQWRTSFNLSFLKNQLLEFPDLENSSFANRLRVGLPINSPRYPLNAEWSQVFQGVDPDTGLPIFEDLDGNGVINNNDRTYIGSAIPRTFGGLDNSFSYKGFELSVFFQFSQQLATNWQFFSVYPGQLNNPVAADFYDNYWTQPGDNAKYPRLWSGAASNTTTNLLNNIYRFSSAGLDDVFYVRLKNLSLSYNLPSAWVSKVKMNRAAIYVRGQNLLTWTSRELYKDPELITLQSGMILKTWTAGLQLTF